IPLYKSLLQPEPVTHINGTELMFIDILLPDSIFDDCIIRQSVGSYKSGRKQVPKCNIAIFVDVISKSGSDQYISNPVPVVLRTDLNINMHTPLIIKFCGVH